MGKKVEESMWLNNQTYKQYLDRLTNFALNVFEWTGLPDSVSEEFMERTLFSFGSCLFFKDKTMGFMALPVTLGGKLNPYNEPVDYYAVSTGYHEHYTMDDSVVIYNNFLRLPTAPVIESYAYRLYEVERTLDVNIKAQKTPIVILCEESQRLTMKNLWMQYDGNVPFIFGNKGLDIDAFQVLKTDAPFVADKLMLYKHDIWNECMTYLGITNSNSDKKERLVEAEVSANDEQVEVSRFIALNARKKACDKINKMFGLSVDVAFRIQAQEEEQMEEMKKEEKENGSNPDKSK